MRHQHTSVKPELPDRQSKNDRDAMKHSESKYLSSHLLQRNSRPSELKAFPCNNLSCH